MRKKRLYSEVSNAPQKKWRTLKMCTGIFSVICCLMLFSSTALTAQNASQNIRIYGQVLDAANKEPLVGVSVFEVNTTNGTVTDFDGNYELYVPANSQIRFSYIGYKTVDKTAVGNTPLNVTLVEDASELEELIVVGYGTQRKQDLTGSVAVVDMKEAQKLTAGSVAEILQGQVPGVSIQSSGDPGSMGRVSIRGIGSFNSGGPLYVVDGLVVNDINHVNPNDIESAQVLKDASSGSIYGTRAMHGVIIVTTKKGKEGRPNLNVTATVGVQEFAKKIKMMNTVDYLYYNQLSYLNAGVDWPANPEAGTYLPNSDFQRAIFQRGKVQDYNVSYTQGTENTSLMMSVGYFNQEGVLKGPEYNRFTYRVNSEGRYGAFKIGENITLSHARNKETNAGSFTNALIMPPVIPIYDPDEPSGRGEYGYGSVQYPTYTSNPVALQESIDNTAVNNRILANIYGELELFKVLTYRLNLGLDYWYGRRKEINNVYTMRMGSAENKFDNVLNEIRDERMTLLVENTLTYRQRFGNHNIEALLGQAYETNNWNYLRAEGYDQKVPGLWQIDLVGVQNNMFGSQQENRLISYFGRINYNYADRYLLQFNIRADGSSKFGFENRWGYYPSGSVGWRIMNESFMESLRGSIDDLKLRVSYGVLGDMSVLGNYATKASIDYSGPYEGFYAIFGPEGAETINEGALQSDRVNTALRWEKKATFNIGLDYAFLRNRLYGSIEWFNSKSSDILVNLPTAWATGVEAEYTNYGKLDNRGFEISVSWRDKAGDFSYSVMANLSTVKNTVIDLGESFREGGWNGVNRAEKGRSVGDFYLVETDGIFQSMDEVFAHTATLEDGTVVLIQPDAQPGDIRYVDYNKDGKIDILTDRQWMGSPFPKFQAGLNLSAEYKGMDLTMFWQTSYGNKIFNVQRYDLLKFDVDNLPADVQPWTWDNPTNEQPRPYASSSENRKAQTDRYLEDGSYLRLKNLQVGYTFPQKWMEPIYVSRCRLYLSAQNLWTITKYSGYDPEVLNTDVFGQGNDYGNYPPVRSFNVGLQVTF